MSDAAGSVGRQYGPSGSLPDDGALYQAGLTAGSPMSEEEWLTLRTERRMEAARKRESACRVSADRTRDDGWRAGSRPSTAPAHSAGRRRSGSDRYM